MRRKEIKETRKTKQEKEGWGSNWEKEERIKVPKKERKCERK